ncbi:ABC transporter ATP-binding protein [Desulfuromonas acetoxidans]|uniref:ABC transporter related n=1 Tax=Desulfuromonas acetoxidans (strain DSM 684 / 11070) TaxID=281689 RepID=Q1JW76_DESA6|nr:ABC transporter ATP-binding protein [Desulfuromonas acetoxidans]EAT14492.1 ABC transporter related [Desulfuromonas acetoxidans DSM 684]MBF0646234.1 ABC transporter ATP-binding protein [Desulfuromonas acetoxidans]NVD25078.1 ABC transporter ATP-binding protein [Desulfuromonas acetoxidans]NVE17123.1 ABC transporter ATP-binding protein [Desulfuromonas acetoxidans]
MSSDQHTLHIHQLSTFFFTTQGIVKAVRDVSLSLAAGQTLALVGESGCGKSMTALSVLRLVPQPGRIVTGQIYFGDVDLLQLSNEEMRRVRGNRIAMIFQDPMTALNPVFNIGSQLEEVLKLHLGLDRKAAQQKSVDLLHQVGIPSPAQRCHDYPHQLSGGMRQRVMIAMALACNPEVLIADEPTTALDVTIQAQIMALLDEQRQQRRMANLLISHDLGVVAQNADIVAIMYDGLIVEQAPVTTLFNAPRHPYTQGLLNCIPHLGQRHKSLSNMPQGSFWQNCSQDFAPRGAECAPLCTIGENHLVRMWE